MKIIGAQVRGDVLVDSDTQYNNIMGENVTVAENIMARFYGIILKNLIIKKGATVYLHEKFQGELINEGGILYLFSGTGEIETFIVSNES